MIMVKRVLKDMFWGLGSGSTRTFVAVIRLRCLSSLQWQLTILQSDEGRLLYPLELVNRVTITVLFSSGTGIDGGWWFWPHCRSLDGWTVPFCCLFWKVHMPCRSLRESLLHGVALLTPLRSWRRYFQSGKLWKPVFYMCVWWWRLFRHHSLLLLRVRVWRRGSTRCGCTGHHLQW